MDRHDVDATSSFVYALPKPGCALDATLPVMWDKRATRFHPNVAVLFADLHAGRVAFSDLITLLDSKASCYARPVVKPVIASKKWEWLRWLIQG